jgi:glycerol-3-phosphate acyltransferase PlsY
MEIAALLGAYLLGSMSWAVWVGRWFYGVDVREHGSGNAGATNTFRVLGKKAGTVVLLLDGLKGFTAVQLSWLIPSLATDVDFRIILGLASVFGHIFPVFTGFRGGKGIATLLGAVIAIHTSGALLAMAVFVAVLLMTRYVSLSSMVAAWSFPIWLMIHFEEMSRTLIIFSLAIAALVMVTHQKNIQRLLEKKESKVPLWGKKPTV